MPYVSIQDAIKQNPDYVKANYPQIFSQYTQQVEQPSAGLAQTQTSTAATAANIPGIQAESGIKQIQQQQAGALQNLGKDLQNKITLKGALAKYTPLGMSPDDIFKQYLAQSPWGLPKESPQQLQEMGVKPETLGQIGVPGSFMDRYNTKNAITGLRDLQDKFKNTNAISKLPFLGDATPTGQAYGAARTVFGNHLASLIPGTSGSQSTGQSLLNTLPNVGDALQLEPGAAQGKFNSVEDQLLKTKGYTYKDIGVDAPKKEDSGGNLLKTLLGGAMNTFQDIREGSAYNKIDPKLQEAQQQASTLANQAANTQDPNLRNQLYSQAKQINQGISQTAGEAGKNFSSDVSQNPLLRALGAASQVATTAEIPGAISGAKQLITSETPKLLNFLNPDRAISQSGGVRDAVVNAATTEGKTISGNKILNNILDWSKTAKRGNLGQGGAIDQAIQDATDVFKGQKLTPAEVANIYKEADSGFTRTGIPKTPIQSNIDRGLRNILKPYLEDAAPGWKAATQDMAKAYASKDSTLRKGLINLAKYGLPLAGGGAGADILGHYLFGGNQK